MFVRLRWFSLGALSSVGLLGWFALKVVRARERITPGSLIRQGARTVADLLDVLSGRAEASEE